MDIGEATEGYERWLRRETAVVTSALADKHARMRDDLYAFLRGTFYRWAQCYAEAVPEAAVAPRLIAVGDLHADSFGTWRDSEGRLAWGVDDFDDSYPLPYTSDLVRLATSLKIARDTGLLHLKLRSACEAILDGYESTLGAGGKPMVFAESHEHLEKLGIEFIEPPRSFWRKLEKRPAVRGVPVGARRALRALVPRPLERVRIVRREAGLGSLGQPRFTLIAQHQGGAIAREVKALIPSACVYALGRRGRGQPYYARAMRHAVRSHDPFHRVVGRWILRRLSPDSNPIYLETLKAHDELRLVRAMGIEAANVHLGSRTRIRAVLADLNRRPSDWLHAAAKTMAKFVERDWKEYQSLS